MGTSPALISRWKKGDITPSMESYEKLCKILNADLDWLLTGVIRSSHAEGEFMKDRFSCDCDIVTKQQEEIVELYKIIHQKDEKIISMLTKKKHSKKIA
jgi:transcriptional regulator with XRE-family HTH domain